MKGFIVILCLACVVFFYLPFFLVMDFSRDFLVASFISGACFLVVLVLLLFARVNSVYFLYALVTAFFIFLYQYAFGFDSSEKVGGAIFLFIALFLSLSFAEIKRHRKERIRSRRAY